MGPGGLIKYGTDWPEFKKWLDGTCGRYPYSWEEDIGAYTVWTLDAQLPRIVAIPKSEPASGNQLDFEATWKKLTYSPRLQLNTSGSVTCITEPGAAASNGVAFGFIATSATTNVPIRPTTYTEPSVGAQRSFASSSANDRLASTGARTVKVTYYDASMNGPFTETVTLNGATAVATVATNICFVESMEVVTAGSGGTNAGVITLYTNTTGGAGAIASIATGIGLMQYAHRYVPPGRAIYITQMSAAVTANASLVTLVQRDLVANVNLQISESIRAATAQASVVRTFSQPLCVVGPSRVVMFAQPSSAAAMTTYGSFDYYEV